MSEPDFPPLGSAVPDKEGRELLERLDQRYDDMISTGTVKRRPAEHEEPDVS